VTKRRRYAIVVLIGLCVGLGFGAVADAKSPFGIKGPEPVPGQFRESLPSGHWDVYQRTGTRTGGSVGAFSYSDTRRSAPELNSSMIVVTAPNGHQLPVNDQSGAAVETLQKGPDLYTKVADFDAPSSGTYSLAVHSPGPEQVILARPILSAVLRFLPWAAAAAAGALCFVIGLILLIVEYRRGPQSTSGG
jgi:hypothetical protein